MLVGQIRPLQGGNCRPHSPHPKCFAFRPPRQGEVKAFSICKFDKWHDTDKSALPPKHPLKNRVDVLEVVVEVEELFEFLRL